MPSGYDLNVYITIDSNILLRGTYFGSLIKNNISYVELKPRFKQEINVII